ncbi:unnamed protein product [Cylicostephanus goldi]|uniref:Uncharacterized protein n=1 Tax=Cylicostephanus goldi TaxID=71465 RepID=A0A3P7M9A5_CYLGO|nr:unnamed protein product [Cylicostephanus goldi]
MDVHYDLETVDEDLKKVLAHATPVKCQRLCWVSSLRASSAAGETFENTAFEQCQRIEGTEVTDYVRQMSRYTVSLQFQVFLAGLGFLSPKYERKIK